MQQNQSIIDVPDHILDLVAQAAKNYIANNTDVLLKSIAPENHDKILASSTHNLVDTPERRELHRAILQERVAHLPAERPDHRTMLYIAGPMGAGKTTLINEFTERYNEEKAGLHLGEYEDQGMEDVYQSFRDLKKNLVTSDFQYYKSRLPEYAASGNEYALIRAEASGLDVALTQWAKELNANMIIEQRGGRNFADNVENFSKDYNMVVLGVTADPALNAQRLAGRNKETAQVIKAQELASAICDFSTPGSFMNAAPHAQLAVLVEAHSTGYSSIYHAEYGNELSPVDTKACQKFESYSAVAEADMLDAIQGYFTPPAQNL